MNLLETYSGIKGLQQKYKRYDIELSQTNSTNILQTYKNNNTPSR